MQQRMWQARSAAVVGLAVGAVALGSVGAQAATSGMSIKLGHAKVVAHGAAVRVPFSFVCPKGETVALNLNLVEAVAHGNLASGSDGSYDRTCTGKRQTGSFYVQATSPFSSVGRAFRTGTASAAATIGAYDPSVLDGDGSGLLAPAPGHTIHRTITLHHS
jgi:hypothetical protein